MKTPLCNLLGIEVPILQAPMGSVAGPALVGAVSNAGGLGMLPGTMVPPDELRAQIRAIRGLTSRPFAVNLLLHTAFQPPPDPASLPDDTVQRVQSTLNRFREQLGIPPVTARPPRPPDFLDAAFDVILAERVPVFSIGLGRPTRAQIERCQRQHTRVIAMAATVDDAKELAAAGVDAIIAQGSEAGGHRSTWTKRPSPQHAAIGALALVPQVLAAVTVPVVAAGGIVDGRGLVAALALGAGGVSIGTRFIASQESAAPEFYKQALLRAGADDTVVTDALSGLYARALRNDLTEGVAAAGGATFPPLLQQAAIRDVTAASASRGSAAFYPLYAGQGCGAVRDLPAAADLVRGIVADARQTLAGLARFSS